MQKLGCGALLILGMNADNKVEIAKQGGITAILKGMVTHQGHLGVQERGCLALAIIGWSHRDLQEQIKGEGAVKVVKRAMALSNFPANTKEIGQQLLDKLNKV